VMHIGIDIEQFVTDPYGSGIQRVLQYLAKDWPHDVATAEFVIPHRGAFLLLSPEQAADLVSVAFAPREHEDLRIVVSAEVARLAEVVPQVREGALLAMFSAWLLPEVSYLPQVLKRFSIFNQSMPTGMIGYDALPMTEPANYRFKPGTAGDVSEYFRLLATADSVICISEYARTSIMNRLRRNEALITTVAHPGGDHIPVPSDSDHSVNTPVTFLRVGTMEARKMPVELVHAFRDARRSGVKAELIFMGKSSASDAVINDEIQRAVDDGIGVRWIQGASDDEVRAHMARADVFVSVGTEGYGIPVLEALRMGTPVVFGGIQPAGEIMIGSGATDIGGTSHEHLVEMFTQFTDLDRLRALRNEVNPEAVPPWSNFAQAVAQAMTSDHLAS
jgi:glycosyltransferase involved in cell wall biosynthesis